VRGKCFSTYSFFVRLVSEEAAGFIIVVARTDFQEVKFLQFRMISKKNVDKNKINEKIFRFE